MKHEKVEIRHKKPPFCSDEKAPALATQGVKDRNSDRQRRRAEEPIFSSCRVSGAAEKLEGPRSP
jgi:hypothetical protein